MTASASADADAFLSTASVRTTWSLNGSSGVVIGSFTPSPTGGTVNYNTPGNWNTVPNGACQVAYFPQAPVPQTISLDLDVTVGTVTIDSTNSYTINGPGALTIYCPADGGHLNILDGNHTINAQTNLDSDTVVDIVHEADSLTMTALQPSAVNVTKVDPGTWAVNSLQVNSMTINAGTVQILPSSGAGRLNSSISVVSSLSIAGTNGAWTGILDLANNDLIVRNGSLSTINNQVAEGYNAVGGGNWQGGGGILSSAAAADPTRLTALGAIQNSVDGTVAGTALYSAFDGQTVSDTDVIVKFTYYGDSNLDGVVDGSDYSRIDSAYGNNQDSPASALTGWYNGDFNYDGVIDGSDYTLIDNSFNSQGASLAANVTAAGTDQISSLAAVPEPSLALWAAAIPALLRRREITRQLSRACIAQHRAR